MGEDLKQIELPISWCLVSHKEIADINPKILFTNIPEDLEVSFLPMSAVEAVTGKCDLSIIKTFKDVKKGYTPFINGDLIFAKITPCMENGKIAIVNNLANGLGFGSTEFHVSRLSALVNKYYFFYFFNQSIFKKEAKKYMTGSAGQLRVPKAYFENINIPFPPLAEQHRIVAKIEELFSELDKGIESLKKAQEQLKIYRQAVLKYAFEGKLTEKWREQQIREGKLESAESLLEKIKIERERLYQEQLKEWEQSIQQWEANGKQGKKPVKPKTPNCNTKGVILYLDIWLLTKLENISDLITDGTHHTPTYITDGIPFISVKDINNGLVSFNKCKYISEEEHETLIKRCYPQEGDLLITKSGTIGRTAIVPNKIFSLFVSVALIKIQSTKKFIISKWLKYFFDFHFIRMNIDQEIKGGVIKNYHLEDLRQVEIPLCSYQEQNQIVQEIESRLSICDQVEATIIENLQRAESLRQSILKQAFEGKLVPQDPNDEPAEKLLERIKKEKSQINQSLQQELNLEEI